tara:strand:+ start:268 stop:777 length:510 start_codon:yes stop_codon:yes gene_type:complete
MTKRQEQLNGILEDVSNYYGLEITDVTSNSRLSEFVRARDMFAYLCREYTSASYNDIGQMLGGRNHATIIHSNKKINQYAEMYPAVKKQVQEISHRSDLYDRLKNHDVKVRRENVIMSAVNLLASQLKEWNFESIEHMEMSYPINKIVQDIKQGVWEEMLNNKQNRNVK